VISLTAVRPATGFQLVRTADGPVLKIADLVDDDPSKRDRVSAALKDPAQKNNRDHVDIYRPWHFEGRL